MLLPVALALLLLPPLGRPPRARAARATVREAPRVRIPDQGVVSGREVFVTRTLRARQYLGIPFAQPPVGDLRFAAPAAAPPPTWDEPRNSSFQPACMQDRDRFEEHDKLRLEPKLFPDERIEFSEDCLYLNIYTPEGPGPQSEAGLPVLVWLHSGDFNVGATHLWDFSVFAVKQKVIVVTPAYRLNVFGFLSTQDGAAPGNWGLLDQTAALDWVQRRIASFGGDPTRVVLGGHAAGAVSVGLHMVSPVSRGKFAAALQMSGSALSPSAMRVHPRSLIPDMADNFGCDEVMVCLRRISASIMLQQSGAAADWGPVVDGPYANRSEEAFLPAAPRQLLEDGRFAAVPLMAGYADMEEALEFARRHTAGSADADGSFDREAFETLIGDTALEGVAEPDDNETCVLDKTFVRDSVSFFYNSEPSNADGTALKQKYVYYLTEKKYGSSVFNQSYYVSKVKPVYLYRFDYRIKTAGVLELQDWMTAPQFGEIPFVFGMPYWTSIASQIVWNSADKKVADAAMALWGNYTKSFRPAGDRPARNFKWEPYEPDAPALMVLDKVFNMSDPASINYKSLSFWNEYFPKVVRIATQCCNVTNDALPLRARSADAPLFLWTTYAFVMLFVENLFSRCL